MSKIIIIVWVLLVVLVSYTIYETSRFLKIEYTNALVYYYKKRSKRRNYQITKRNDSNSGLIKNNSTKTINTPQINQQIGYAILSFEKNENCIKEEKIFKEKISIGRSNLNDIILNDMTVSREQCLIIKTIDKFIICDLSRTNRTLLNGVPVENNCEIKYGDLVEIGNVKFRFNDVIETIKIG